MNVIIMASGEQVRFGPNQPLKQMLKIWGETLIQRMVNQCHAREVSLRSIYLITHHEELAAHGLELGIRLEDLGPLRSDRLAESILNTAYLWDREDRTIILLGDVFYAYPLMSEILAEREPIRFYGNHLEMFAVSLSAGHVPEFQEACRAAGKYVGPASSAKARKIYQFMAGVSMHGSRMEPALEDWHERASRGEPNLIRPTTALMRFVDDETRDFDVPEAYQTFRRDVLKLSPEQSQ